MRIKENISLNWSKEIPSDSQVRDALGIWTKHLKIQEDFTPGITSVTRRIRYYTLLAWYWENLYPRKIINLTDYEKIFILTCLAHHDGDYNDPRLSYVFNKQAFKGKWNETRNLNLNFKINGFGRIYYTRQLEILKCAWTDMLNRPHTSLINKKLASSLDTVPIEIFKKKVLLKKNSKES